MALTTAGLKSAIKSAQEAAYGAAADATEEDKAAGVLAEAIVTYLLANLVIDVTGTVDSGAGAGGTVTGTGTPE